MKKKSLFLATLALSLTTPAFVQTVETHAETTSFKDIPSSHPHKTEIDKLVEIGVINGFTDNTFRPLEKVTRGQFALFISKALKLPSPSSPKSFSDVGKSSAVYDGVVKAQAAGIISGYTDGRFRPGNIITRGDMAIMLDRALQYKSSFGTKATLTYGDKNSIGATAIAPVQRLTNYKIMGAYSGTSFSPAVHGDRISTVLSIYNLMVTKSLIAGEVVEDDTTIIKKESLSDYTHAELEGILGKWEVLKRSGSDGSIAVIDIVEEMQTDIAKLPTDAPVLKFTPEAYFEYYIRILRESATLYTSFYPLGEYVTINGIPYRESEYFSEYFVNPDPIYKEDVFFHNVIPNPPKEAGKFLIDLPAKNRDIVTYKKGVTDIEKMATVVKKTLTNDYLVDVKALFRDTNVVSVSSDGLTVQHNDKKLVLQPNSNKAILNGQTVTLASNVVVENGVVLVPFKSIADQLNIYWRVMKDAQRFELANYPLEKGIIGWEE